MLLQQIPRGIPGAASEAVLGTYSAIARGTVDYWSGAFARRATPLDVAADVLKWSGEVIQRDRPKWATPHTVKRVWPAARLRDFSSEDAKADEIATVLLPPQAGHDSCIVDYSPRQSQVMTARAAGLTRVFSMDWIGANAANKHTKVDDYLEILHETSQLLGGKINLVGDCQGGWLATLYAALYPDTVNSLTIAGAPIDYHAGEPLLHDWVELLTPGGDIAFYRNIVQMNGGMLPGSFLLTGFMMLQPHNELDRQLQLLAHINDDAYVARYRQFETWFQWTQPLPGDFYLWVVEHLFMNNELLKGTLEIGGRTVKLTDITCPLYLLAGESDHITPPSQVYALAGATSTPADQVHKRLVPGGHLGLFMGRQALEEHWAPTFEEIKKIS